MTSPENPSAGKERSYADLSNESTDAKISTVEYIPRDQYIDVRNKMFDFLTTIGARKIHSCSNFSRTNSTAYHCRIYLTRGMAVNIETRQIADNDGLVEVTLTSFLEDVRGYAKTLTRLEPRLKVQ
jgi:hypothetical protein